MTKDDIRWVQRFDSYKKALAELREAVALSEERPLSKLEEQGLIQVFEFTHELAWKCLKDFLENRGWSRASLAAHPCIRGNDKIYGSKDAVRGAFSLGWSFRCAALLAHATWGSLRMGRSGWI